jgi:signal transduction histidine kinase
MTSEHPSCSETALELLPMSVIMFDESRDLLGMNAAATEMMARINEEALILTLADIEELFGLQPLEPQAAMQRNEVTYNGIALSITRKRVDSGPMRGFLVILTDISGEKRQIAGIHRQTSDLLWKFRSRITPVLNALNLIHDYRDGIDEASLKELINNSRYEIFQIERYLDNFRDLSLINANELKSALCFEEVALEGIVARACRNLDQFSAYTGRKGRIAAAIDPVAMVRTDVERAGRIIESLLINAIIYSDEDKEIAIRSTVDEQEIVCAISDSGFGIVAQDQAKIFNYAFRGENAKRTDYNGLGCELFLARHVLLQMDASISFESREGVGTTFSIAFPRPEVG